MNTTIELAPGQRASLLSAALTQAAATLRTAAGYLELAASNPDRITLADAETQARIVREDLDAIQAIGYGEAL